MTETAGQSNTSYDGDNESGSSDSDGDECSGCDRDVDATIMLNSPNDSNAVDSDATRLNSPPTGLTSDSLDSTRLDYNGTALMTPMQLILMLLG